MKVQVTFFGSLSESIGGPRAVELAEGARVDDLRAAIIAAHPDAVAMATAMVAVDAEYVDAGRVLVEGDDVAFLPPVSGG